MIGLKVGIVELKEHDPSWIILAQEMIDKLKTILKECVLDAKHIGSTAISTIKAKPIIDIALKVNDFKIVHEKMEALNSLGLIHRNHEDMPDAMYFLRRIKKDTITTHHVFMFKEDGLEWDKHVSFCEYMQHHPHEAKTYEMLKESLLKKYPNDRYKYTTSKAEYIQTVLSKIIK